MITRNCQKCEKEFKFKNCPSQIRKGEGKFCSRECRKNRVLKVCQKCNKNFEVCVGNISAKFCSLQCRRTSVIKVCKKCNKKFIVKINRKDTAKFCSMECYRNRVLKLCKICNNIFEIPFSHRTASYCSKTCYGISKEGISPSNKGITIKITRKCLRCKKVFLTYPKPAKRGKFCSALCHYLSRKIYHPKENVMQLRSSFEYKKWRRIVLERNDRRCFDCGQKSDYLEADHLFSFAKYPRLRFIPENGQVVCRGCHINREKLRNNKIVEVV